MQSSGFYMKRHSFLCWLVAAAGGFSAGAAHADNNSFYAGGGTTGASGGYARAIGRHVGARVEVNALDHDLTFRSDDARYDATVSMDTIGAFVDYFPSRRDRFRITVGALTGERRVDLVGTRDSGTVTINDVQYDATGEHMTGTIEWPVAAPYLGVGVGHRQGARGFSFIADLGIIYGNPEVTLAASPGLARAAGESNIEAERRRVQEQADRYKVYPVLKIGIGYAF